MDWLGTYEVTTPSVEVADNTTIRLDLENESQPDSLLRIDEACGGQYSISKNDYVEGAPELIMEIAASSTSYDLHDKLRGYRQSGVREYIVWQVTGQKISWFSLQAGEYVTLLSNETGRICSRIFPGLNLNVSALLAENLVTELAEVQLGVAMMDAHQIFVRQMLQERSYLSQDESK